jgi:hypothetical protein
MLYGCRFSVRADRELHKHRLRRHRRQNLHGDDDDGRLQLDGRIAIVGNQRMQRRGQFVVSWHPMQRRLLGERYCRTWFGRLRHPAISDVLAHRHRIFLQYVAHVLLQYSPTRDDSLYRMSKPTVPPCECPIAGWCARHGFNKNPHQYELCRDRPTYRAHWDRLAEGQRTELRDIDESQRIFTEVCQPCKNFEASKIIGGICGKCACRFNRKGLLAYIRLPHSYCPLGLWGSGQRPNSIGVSTKPADAEASAEHGSRVGDED